MGSEWGNGNKKPMGSFEFWFWFILCTIILIWGLSQGSDNG